MELLLETNLNEEQKSCVGIIASSGQSLQTMLNEVLDFSKLESGKRALLVQETNLHHILQQLTQLFSAIAESKGISLEVEYETELDKLTILTDELCIFRSL
jgi:signal transduction histidine kinase